MLRNIWVRTVAANEWLEYFRVDWTPSPNIVGRFSLRQRHVPLFGETFF